MRLSEYAQVTRDLAKEENIDFIDIYEYFEKYGDGTPKSRDVMLLDGVHPNDIGHSAIAGMIVNEIILNHSRPGRAMGQARGKRSRGNHERNGRGGVRTGATSVYGGGLGPLQRASRARPRVAAQVGGLSARLGGRLRLRPGLAPAPGSH